MIVKELVILSDTDNENFYVENNINTDMDYSSNYLSNSSVDETSSENCNSGDKINKNDSDSSDGDNNNINNKNTYIKDNKKKVIIIQTKIKK